MSKPSERITKAAYEGKEITDALGRVIRLRKPSMLDIYDLMKALGDDAKNPSCVGMAYNILYVGLLDGSVFEAPKTYGEVRAALQRLDEHGLTAVAEGLAQFESAKTEKEAIDSAKK